TFWNELEVIRKAESADVQKYDYAPDPFSVEEQRAKDLKEREREVKVELERVAKESEKMAKPWEAYQKVQLSSDMRAMVEELIRKEDAGEDVVRVVPLDETRRGEIVDSLVAKGFRKVHVEEALEYSSDVSSAIHWLCIYVPEDDLPAAFHAKPTNSVTVGQSTTDALLRERAAQYLIHSGFNKETCEREYDACGGSELKALASLCSKLADNGESKLAPAGVDVSELNALWAEELEAVESILGTDSVSINSRNGMVEIRIDFSTSASVVEDIVELHVGRFDGCLYPYELPPVMVVCSTVPAYIRLALLRGLVREAKEKWLGSGMIFEMVQWIQERFMQVLENPGVSLVELKRVSDGEKLKSVKAAGTVASPIVKKKGRAAVAETEEDIRAKGQELKEKYDAKVLTEEYKRMLRGRQNLPSYKFRDQIIDAVEKNQVVIICGETGCGKVRAYFS
ncbi:hypothetical protein HDU99_005865, partial [Rhizoclosmatium hyalinum]